MPAIDAEPQPEVFSFLFNGKPLNIPSDFILKRHPGGKAVLLPYVGRDLATAFTDAAHSQDAEEMIEEYIAQLSKTVATDEKAALETRRLRREAEEETWRWRSTAIAFSVAAIVAAYVLRPSKN